MSARTSILVACLLLPIVSFVSPALADPCDLVTPADAQTILGEAVQPARKGEVVGLAPGVYCKYFTSAPMAQRGGVGSISLVVHDAKTMKEKDGLYSSPAEFFNKTLEVQRKAKHARIEELTGLGDSAFWQTGSDTLHILAKGSYLVLQIKDLTKFSSNKGRADLDAQISAHRRQKSEEAARFYILPRL